MDGEVTLRPATEADLTLLHRLTSDPAATGEHEWFGFEDPRTWRRRWEENGLLGQDGGTLMIAAGDGNAGFVDWSRRTTARTSSCWNVGIAVAPEERGHGYGTEAQHQLAEYLFRHTQLNRLEAVTEVGNAAEQRALQKAGFTREGVLRGAAFRGGVWRDAVVFSILRAEVDLTGGSPRGSS